MYMVIFLLIKVKYLLNNPISKQELQSLNIDLLFYFLESYLTAPIFKRKC